jgi:predicted nucleic acid-binding protein
VYVSQLLRPEVAQALRNLAARNPRWFPPDLRRQFALDRWASSPAVRRRWLAFGLDQLEVLLALFREPIEVPVSRVVWERSIRLMADFNLKSYDAVHVATAREHRLRHFVTADREFRSVRSLRLWLTRDDS